MSKSILDDGIVGSIDIKSVRLDVVRKHETTVRKCAFCEIDVSKAHWARHIRSCGGPSVCYTCLRQVPDLAAHQKLCNVRTYDCVVCGESFLSA